MLEDFATRILSIDYKAIFKKVIEGERDFILDLIREQLSHGEKPDGSGIGTYSKSKLGQFYVEKKKELGLFKGNSLPYYDLYYSGEFYGSFVLTVNGEFIEIESTDPKQPLIDETIGLFTDELLELNQENLDLLAERIKPKIQNAVRNQL